MNSRTGCGIRVGSGHIRFQTIYALTATIGSDSQRIGTMWRRTNPPTPSSRAITKPSTNTSCQASGLKNHCPSTGQVGTGSGTISVAM